MKKVLMAVLIVPVLGYASTTAIKTNNGTLTVSSGGKELFSYRFQPLENPKGGEKFKGSNFIHPLRTPAGFCVTDLQPDDHLHHFGLWWPWKKIRVDGREIIIWELQKGEGLIQAQQAVPSDAGFIADSDYIDRTAPDGPLVVLKEKAVVQVSDFKTAAARGYYLDLTITHACATEHPVEVAAYRYSGFSLRAAGCWNKDNSTLLTSDGKDRSNANFTRAAWVKVEGATPEEEKAGILLAGHPSNRSFPEFLRTWNEQHGGAVFINFNPVQQVSWTFEPGTDYILRYRVFVYDGKLNEEQADRLWKEYSNE